MMPGPLKQRMRRNSIRIRKYTSIRYTKNPKKLFSVFNTVSTKGGGCKCQRKMSKATARLLGADRTESKTHRLLLKNATSHESHTLSKCVNGHHWREAEGKNGPPGGSTSG